MSQQYVDRFPDAAAVVRAALASSYIALGIGGLLGLVQALHRTGYFRGFVSSAEYYTVLTAHGVLLALVFTTFFLVGLFTWAVTDSLDRPLPSPRLTWSWYGLMLVGSLSAFVTILGGFVFAQKNLPIPDEFRADVLFTFYAPLEAHPLFYVGLAVFIVGTWIAGVDWFRTWWAWRNDNPDERTPLRTFMVLTTTIMWYLSSIGVAVSVLGLLLPWSLEIVDSVNALLTRTLFWYFGHAVVYFWLMPAYLLWYTVLPKLAGGRLFSDPLARVVFVLFLLLSTPTGIHHQYLDPGIAEGFKFIAMTNTMFLLLPSLLTAFTVVASMEYGARKRGGTGLFGWLTALPWRDPAFAGMSLAGLMFAAGGFSGMVNAGMNVNYLVHNTLWLPGHFHLTVGTAVALTFMAAAYWIVPQLTGKALWGRTIGLIQVVVWFIGMTLMSNAMHRAGLLGVPRRTAEPMYQSFEYQSTVGSIGELQAQIALGGTLLFVSLVLFFVVLIGTVLGRASGEPLVDGTLPPAISGPEDAPTVLDNLTLWTAIAVVLVILAYALPLASIVGDGGLLGPGIKGIRAQIDIALEVITR